MPLDSKVCVINLGEDKIFYLSLGEGQNLVYHYLSAAKI
jgi:hypothetical protein